MHISLSVTTLVEILAVIIVLAILFSLINLRRRGRVPKGAPRSRTPRATPGPRTPRATPRSRAKRSWGFPSLIGRRAPSGTRDHGQAVALKYGHSRSPQWPAVAHAHLAIQPACMVCGHRGQGLQVHHIKPFHLYPQLELDPGNLITLCEIRGRDHHLLIGHLDDWESYNPQVRVDVKNYHKENALTIRANPAWQKEEQHRPQPHP
jgi:5-methylcytosine-specific restriction endonuclease McrA